MSISVLSTSFIKSRNVMFVNAKEAFQSSQAAGNFVSSVLTWMVVAVVIIIDWGSLAPRHGRDLHGLVPTTKPLPHLARSHCCFSLTSTLPSTTVLVMRIA